MNLSSPVSPQLPRPREPKRLTSYKRLPRFVSEISRNSLKHLKFFVFLSAICVFFAGNASFAKELPEIISKYKREDYPEYETYFKNYREKLDKAFEPEKHFSKLTDLYVIYYYRISKDGTISDFYTYKSTNDLYEYINGFFLPRYRYRMKEDSPKFDKYVKEIIYNNLPDKFPEELEYDKFRIMIIFSYFPRLSKGIVFSTKEEPPFEYDSSGEIHSDGFVVYPGWDLVISREKD